MQTTDLQNILEFLRICGKLKHIKRTGWVENDIKEPETIASHMYRMGILGFLMGELGRQRGIQYNVEKVIKMSIVHDLGEAIVGDLSPKQMRDEAISKEEKFRREKEAMEYLASLLPTDSTVGAEIISLWNEYETQSTLESHIVKDFDRFDMILQADDYEKSKEQNVAGKRLDQFFKNCEPDKFNDPLMKQLAQELFTQRNTRLEENK